MRGTRSDKQYNGFQQEPYPDVVHWYDTDPLTDHLIPTNYGLCVGCGLYWVNLDVYPDMVCPACTGNGKRAAEREQYKTPDYRDFKQIRIKAQQLRNEVEGDGMCVNVVREPKSNSWRVVQVINKKPKAMNVGDSYFGGDKEKSHEFAKELVDKLENGMDFRRVKNYRDYRLADMEAEQKIIKMTESSEPENTREEPDETPPRVTEPALPLIEDIQDDESDEQIEEYKKIMDEELKKYSPVCGFCGNNQNLLRFNNQMICSDCRRKMLSVFPETIPLKNPKGTECLIKAKIHGYLENKVEVIFNNTVVSLHLEQVPELIEFRNEVCHVR